MTFVHLARDDAKRHITTLQDSFSEQLEKLSKDLPRSSARGVTGTLS